MEFDERQVRTKIYAEDYVKAALSFRNFSIEQSYVLIINFLITPSNYDSYKKPTVVSEVAALAKHIGLVSVNVMGVDEKLNEVYDRHLEGPAADESNYASSLALYFIDQILKERYDLDEYQPKVSSVFVNAISPASVNTVIDKIPIAVELERMTSWYHTFLIAKPSDEFIDSIVNLRLSLKGTAARLEEHHSLLNIDGATFVFDSPATTFRDNEVPSAAREFANFAMSTTVAGRFIVIMPASKNHSLDIEEYVAPLLNGQLDLEAVVVFSTREKGRRLRDYQAFVLTRGLPREKTQALYVDVSGSNSALDELNSQECASLAASIINLYREERFQKRHLTSNVIRILNAQFGSGYCDVKKLCAEVAQDHGKVFRLGEVKRVLARKASRGHEVNFSADAHDILGRIQNRSMPSCTYIIGDNGAGKSFLLRDLVYRISKLGLHTCGVSTGINDRFPLSDSALEKFEYKGIRSARGGVDASKVTKNATRLAAQIFRNQTMIDALSECLHVLGYEARYYFTRRPETALADDPNDAQFKILSLFAGENDIPRDLLSYEFGVVRSDDRDAITPISSLSSGERNINYLLLSLVRLSSKGRVFLIDEPEISLHLHWQQALPKVFHILSRRFDVSFIVATHSPTLIASANEASDFCYELNSGHLRILNEEDRYSVESIILGGFGTYTPNNRSVHERCARLVARSMAEEEPGMGDFDALNELDDLKKLLIEKVDRQNVPGVNQDLDLIKKAYAAIELLLADRLTMNGAK
ncbi:AAA family ATPase [Pseudomonas putida]|uniref:AAA family ATPase n=1 Tax=Pseudomonas putida TaxID=303 RepID=UPI003570A70D